MPVLPMFVLVPIFTPWYGEASLSFKETCSASPPGSGGSGDRTPATHMEAMLPNHYTTLTHKQN